MADNNNLNNVQAPLTPEEEAAKLKKMQYFSDHSTEAARYGDDQQRYLTNLMEMGEALKECTDPQQKDVINKEIEYIKKQHEAQEALWQKAIDENLPNGPADIEYFKHKVVTTHIDAEGKEIEEAVTEDVTDKKCPNCAATVTYDPATLSMTCPFCGYSRQLPKPEDGDQGVDEIDFQSAVNRASLDWGKEQKSLVCKNCGAETVFDAADTAACCPYCGSTQVMPVDDDVDIMAPGGVVPFEITQQKASELFKKWLSGKLFAVTAAKKSSEAKSFNGVYLPYWTYDSQTTSSYRVKLGFKRKVGDKIVTDYKTYSGIYEKFIDDEVVYASKKTDNPHIKAVSTFDFSKLRKYSPEFIAGFMAERYTVGLDDGWQIAQNQIKSKLRSEIGSAEKKRHNADVVSEVDFATNFANVTFKYVLAPIWISNFKFNGQVYNFVVNGQTGKISGKYPISPIKVAIAIAIVIALIALFLWLRNS